MKLNSQLVYFFLSITTVLFEGIQAKLRMNDESKLLQHERSLAIPGIMALYLHSARADRDITTSRIMQLTDGTTFDLLNTGTELSLVAETTIDILNVTFQYDSATVSYTDIKKPVFAMNGDELIDVNGIKMRRLFPVYDFNTKGTKIVTATAYNSLGMVDTITMTYTVAHTPKFPPQPWIASKVPFIEQNGLVVMEAESVLPTNQFSDWKYENDFLGYTGNGYYRFDSNALTGGSPKGKIHYNFTITTPGRYEVMLRTSKNNPDITWSNDCFITFMPAGNTSNKLYANGGRYKWLTSTTLEGPNHTSLVPYFDVTAPGTYGIELAGRSKNFYLDRIILFLTPKHKKADIMTVSSTLLESPREGIVGAPTPVFSPIFTQPNPAPISPPSPVAAPVAPVPAPITPPYTAPTLAESAYGFYFVDVKTNIVLYDLKSIVNGATYSFAQGTNLTLVAQLQDSVFGVEYKYPGGKRLEQTKPFTMAGDLSGIYFNVAYLYTQGEKKINITEYGSGLVVTKNYLLTFTIAHSDTAPVTVPPPVLPPVSPPVQVPAPVSPPLALPTVVNSANGFYFVDVKTNIVRYDLKVIVNGATYKFESGTNLTLVAQLSDSVFGVEYKYPGGKRLEQTKPFTMAGDLNGTYFNVAYLYSQGEKKINITEYGPGLVVTKNYILTFTIAHSAIAPILAEPAPVLPPLAPLPAPVAAPVPISSPTPISSDLSNGKWFVTGTYNVTADTPEVCFVMVGRQGVLIGGRGARKPWMYNPVTRTWREGSYPPEKFALHHMQCVVVDNKVWIVSPWTGETPQEQTVPFVYFYDPILDKWGKKTAMPIERRRGGAAAVAVGHLIYVLFGNQGGHETADHATALTYTDVYDTKTDTWRALANANFARDHTGGALVNVGKICVSGGRDGGTIIGRLKNQNVYPKILPTECYDIASDTWSIQQNVLTAREESAYGTSCDGKLLMAAGKLNITTGASKQFDIFDGTTWTRLSDLKTGRYGSGLAVDCICNAIYVANPLGNPEMMSVETFFFGGVDVPCLA